MIESLPSMGTLVLIATGLLVSYYCLSNRFMVSQSLVFINFSIFAGWWMIYLVSPKDGINALLDLGFKSKYLAEPQFRLISIITAMFMHGGWMHLIGNMLYLWIFADNIEDDLGTLNFVIFYFVCGIGAAMSQVLVDINSQIPMIGASGAIGGVLGAYLINYPNARVLVLIPFGFFSQLLKIRALYVLGFWFVLQFINSFLSTSSSGGGVAYAAHIGGFISGLILILFFNKRNIRNNLKKSSKNIKKKGPWEQ